MDELGEYLYRSLRSLATCPRCDIELPTTAPWCWLCGDSYPWPKRDDPMPTPDLHGILPEEQS
jgi:hypothetical protein